MKKIFLLFLIAIMLCSCSSEDKEGRYSITVSMQMVDNNHVGNSWSKEIWCEDQKIYSGSTVTAPNKFTVYVDITENDEYDDTGSGVFTFSKIAVGSSKSITETIYVKENRGQYTGNTATWRVTVTARRVS
jgi:predicted RecA/RadA family phage recombinase